MFFWDSRFLVEFCIGNMYKNGYGSKSTPQNGWLRFRNWRPQMIGLLLVHRTQNDGITQLTFRKNYIDSPVLVDFQSENYNFVNGVPRDPPDCWWFPLVFRRTIILKYRIGELCCHNPKISR
jgi:hypothetical protein